jgi:hypothetical protein
MSGMVINAMEHVKVVGKGRCTRVLERKEVVLMGEDD